MSRALREKKCSATKKAITSEELVDSFCKFLPKIKKEVEEQEKPVSSFVTVLRSPDDVVEKDEKKKKTRRKSEDKGDTDIFSVDRRIREEFEREKNSIVELEKRKKRLEWIKRNAVNKIERKKAEDEIFFVIKNITSILKEDKKKTYIERTKDILDEISVIMSKPVVCSFMSNDTHLDENSKRLNELFRLYFSVASKFTYIDPGILPKTTEQYMCDACGNDVFDMSEEGRRECIKCGKIVNVMEMHLSYKDTERINLVPRYTYSKDGHFRSAIDKFQGKQNKTISEEVYKIIYNEIDKYDIYTRETITKPAIYDILNQNGLGDYYEDLNLIHWKVTGKPPPDISQYKSILIDMNARFEKVYDEIKAAIGKDNALNVNHKLMRFLEFLGYYADEDDLIGLKTRNKKLEHDEVMEEAFVRLGWTIRWK